MPKKIAKCQKKIMKNDSKVFTLINHKQSTETATYNSRELHWLAALKLQMNANVSETRFLAKLP